jgi:PAS domain S-box-containing protein
VVPRSDLRALPLVALVDAAPYGIAVFDREARYVYVNRHMASINGLPADEHVGRRPLELFPYPAVANWVRLVERVLATGEAIGPIRFGGDADARGSFDVAYHPVHDAGAVVGVVATVRDISPFADAERRQAAVTATIQAISAGPWSTTWPAAWRIAWRSPSARVRP